MRGEKEDSEIHIGKPFGFPSLPSHLQKYRVPVGEFRMKQTVSLRYVYSIVTDEPRIVCAKYMLE